MGLTRGRGSQPHCLRTQAGQGPWACCVPPWVRTQKESKREPEVQDSQAWELAGQRWWGRNTVGRGGPEVALGPGPATRWRPEAGNGGQGARGSSKAQGEGRGSQVLSPWGCCNCPWPPSTQAQPHTTTHEPMHQAQAGRPTPESHVLAQTNMPLPTPPPRPTLSLFVLSMTRFCKSTSPPPPKSKLQGFKSLLQNKLPPCRTQKLPSYIPCHLLLSPCLTHPPKLLAIKKI